MTRQIIRHLDDLSTLTMLFMLKLHLDIFCVDSSGLFFTQMKKGEKLSLGPATPDVLRELRS